jgi:hypothetical protein
VRGKAKPEYGEVNSLGPETAPLLHAASSRTAAAPGIADR